MAKNCGVVGSSNNPDEPPSKKPRNLAINNPSEFSDVASPNKSRLGCVDLDLLDCPICCEPLQPPIFQCENGHLVCDSCYKKIHNKCPSCSLPIGSNRNRAVEGIVESAITSCAYKQHGCTKKVSYLKKSQHENNCKYTPILCPLLNCEYVGAFKSLYTHCAENHQIGKFSFNKARNMLLQDGGELFIFQESDEQILFLLHRIIAPLGSFVKMTCVAPAGSDMKFSYELSVKKGDKIVSVISPVELKPDSLEWPDKEKCLLITNEFHELKDGHKCPLLKLVIRKSC